MILLYNPLSTTPGKQPLPLSVLSLAVVIDGRYDWTLIDANVDRAPARRIIALARAAPARDRLLGVTVMAGPQLDEAVPVCREVKQAVPDLPIVWGGTFPPSTPTPCSGRRMSISSSGHKVSGRCSLSLR